MNELEPTEEFPLIFKLINVNNKNTEYLKFKLNDFNIIVGPNNIGKTNVLKCINVAFLVLNATVETNFLNGNKYPVFGKDILNMVSHPNSSIEVKYKVDSGFANYLTSYEKHSCTVICDKCNIHRNHAETDDIDNSCQEPTCINKNHTCNGYLCLRCNVDNFVTNNVVNSVTIKIINGREYSYNITINVNSDDQWIYNERGRKWMNNNDRSLETTDIIKKLFEYIKPIVYTQHDFQSEVNYNELAKLVNSIKNNDENVYHNFQKDFKEITGNDIISKQKNEQFKLYIKKDNSEIDITNLGAIYNIAKLMYLIHAKDSRIILLDEPSSGCREDYVGKLINVLKTRIGQSNKIVIYTTHDHHLVIRDTVKYVTEKTIKDVNVPRLNDKFNEEHFDIFKELLFMSKVIMVEGRDDENALFGLLERSDWINDEIEKRELKSYIREVGGCRNMKLKESAKSLGIPYKAIVDVDAVFSSEGKNFREIEYDNNSIEYDENIRTITIEDKNFIHKEEYKFDKDTRIFTHTDPNVFVHKKDIEYLLGLSEKNEHRKKASDTLTVFSSQEELNRLKNHLCSILIKNLDDPLSDTN